MPKFVPDHLKIKKMCKHAVIKLPFVIRAVPDRFNIQEMCDKTIIENGVALKSVLDCYKNQFLPECYKTQEMCRKGADTCLLYLIMFLVNLRLKKCVIKLFLMILLC